jgi:hypothetical protein
MSFALVHDAFVPRCCCLLLLLLLLPPPLLAACYLCGSLAKTFYRLFLGEAELLFLGVQVIFK